MSKSIRALIAASIFAVSIALGTTALAASPTDGAHDNTWQSSSMMQRGGTMQDNAVGCSGTGMMGNGHMMSRMQGMMGPMMWGMAIFWLLLFVTLALLIAALIKYLFKK